MLEGIKMKFFEYDFSLFKDGSIQFNELEACKLNIKTGDAFLSIVDPDTKEVKLKKIDLRNYEHIEAE